MCGRAYHVYPNVTQVLPMHILWTILPPFFGSRLHFLRSIAWGSVVNTNLYTFIPLLFDHPIYTFIYFYFSFILNIYRLWPWFPPQQKMIHVPTLVDFFFFFYVLVFWRFGSLKKQICHDFNIWNVCCFLANIKLWLKCHYVIRLRRTPRLDILENGQFKWSWNRVLFSGCWTFRVISSMAELVDLFWSHFILFYCILFYLFIFDRVYSRLTLFLHGGLREQHFFSTSSSWRVLVSAPAIVAVPDLH